MTDTSLLRRANDLLFTDTASWFGPNGLVPPEVIAQFTRPDGKTSLWDEGASQKYRDIIVLALALQSQRIGKIGVAPIFTRELSADLLARLKQDEGQTPIKDARSLHYELQQPVESDYKEFALAAASRGDVFSLPTPAIADMIEDALLAKMFDPNDLNDDLRLEVKNKIEKRHILPVALKDEAEHPIFDLRRDDSPNKIKNARWIDSEKVRNEQTLPAPTSKRDAITLYCENGGTSLRAARVLRRNGYLGVRILVGGFEAWMAM